MQINENMALRVNYQIARFKARIIGSETNDIAIIRHIKELIAKGSPLVHVSYYHNLVPNVFFYELAKRCAAQTTSYTLNANKIVVGNDGTAASASDTALRNELIRSDFSLRSQVNNVALLDKYFSATDVGGYTLLEAGVMTDAQDSIGGTGLLASRVVINEAISADESLTFNITFTFTNG